MADAVDLFRRDGDKPTLAWDELLPQVTLYLHFYAGELTGASDGDGLRLRTTDPASLTRIEGLGAVTDTWARHALGDQAKFTIRPVFHPHDQAPVHAWEIPDRHRQAVSILTPADVFPFGSTVVNQTDGWRSLQIDHTEAWRPVATEEPEGLLSRIGNYGPLSRFHHLVKTHGNWEVKQPFPGIYLWRDPHGATYLVDQTGTRQLRATFTLDMVGYQAV